jgi:large subunit ribosomal protein L20
MSRVKRGKIAHKRRKKLLKQVKGYKFARKRKYRMAKEALFKALSYAYSHRKQKKRIQRALWQTKISAALKQFSLSYSKFMNLLKKKNIKLNRKMLSALSETQPKIFEQLVKQVVS